MSNKSKNIFKLKKKGHYNNSKCQ